MVCYLNVDETDEGYEKISWKEILPYYVWGSNRLTAKEFTRRIKGPVSHMRIWDRSKNKFIDGWGPGEIPE
jgi:hypothetical protein